MGSSSGTRSRWPSFVMDLERLLSPSFAHSATWFTRRITQEAVQQRALRTLKQKRMYESQLAQLVQQTFNMESAALATENLRNTMATVNAMQQANKEMKKQYGKIDIDKIEVRTSNTVECNPSAQRRGL